MSLMKRGSLTCLFFFVLAIVSNAGAGAAKVAKVFGALIIVGILVTSPIFQTNAEGQETGVLPDIDALIKNDWVGTDETSASGTSASADTGTQSATTTLTQSEISKITNSAIGSPAYNAFTAEIRAFKSGEVWKVPTDAIDSIEQTGVHGISKAVDTLKSLLGILLWGIK